MIMLSWWMNKKSSSTRIVVHTSHVLIPLFSTNATDGVIDHNRLNNQLL